MLVGFLAPRALVQDCETAYANDPENSNSTGPSPTLHEVGGLKESVLVEAMGLEPTTSSLQRKCSSQLSYAPVTRTR